ncbi:hypothetical protein Catovirus_2_196 [Catovirus CTV1]|uniref:Uncharacterized protein n=1 Tax=Catovirus CTV1 TaxID=1977631 RepID=A0A1V0SBZ8_9VIRU|nr:hypothetical protein Catovirus_2_196 [Catovirus CTV1]
MNLNRGDFTEYDFNKKFEQEKELVKQLNNQKEKDRLDKLNNANNIQPKSLYELSVIDILIGIKDSWFEMIDELLQGKFDVITFTKNNRLFYIGITIIVIVLMLYMYGLFTESQSNSNEKIVKIYHIKQN